MPFKHGTLARVYWNGYDLTPFLNEFGEHYACDANDASVLNNTKKVYQAGLEFASLDVAGLFKADTTGTTLDQIDDILKAALAGTIDDVIFAPQGDTFNTVAIGYEGIETDYSIDAQVHDLIKTSAKMDSCKARDRLLTLLAYQGASSITAGGNGTSIDNTASSAKGGVGYLMVPVHAGGGPTITFKIQHSVDNSTWVDLITFTAASVAHNFQRIEVAGTVNRYTRALWTVSGNPAAKAYVGFGRW